MEGQKVIGKLAAKAVLNQGHGIQDLIDGGLDFWPDATVLGGKIEEGDGIRLIHNWGYCKTFRGGSHGFFMLTCTQ